MTKYMRFYESSQSLHPGSVALGVVEDLPPTYLVLARAEKSQGSRESKCKPRHNSRVGLGIELGLIARAQAVYFHLRIKVRLEGTISRLGLEAG